MIDRQELEAIKRLKYRYFRCLDLKRWDELKECFVEDATSAYGGGERPTYLGAAKPVRDQLSAGCRCRSLHTSLITTVR